MKELKLKNGKIVIIDDEDFDNVLKFTWRESKKGRIQCTMELSCFIAFLAGLDFSGKTIDHVDANLSNNIRKNLRVATYAENLQNRSISRANTSEFKGISWSKKHNCWYAHIGANGKGYYLGHFNNKIDAARIYNQKALEIFGKFARINDLENPGTTLSVALISTKELAKHT